MPILALLAPVAAIILSLLLALAVCHAVLYGGVWACLVGPKSRPQQSDSNPEATGRVQTLSMLGMHIEDLKGASMLTIKDHQHAHQQAVMQLFKAHGHRNNNIHTTFSNPEMEVLLLPGVGCMVYTTAAYWGLKLVVAVGDPVCEPQHDLLMLQTFKAVFPEAAMIDVSKEVAKLWTEAEGRQPGPSMTATDMGTETVISVQDYHLEFNQKTKIIRRSADVAARAGLIVEEVTAHNADTVSEQMQQLAAEWQSGKEVTDHLKILSRIIPFQHLGREKDVRVFIARTLNPGEEPPFTVAMATQQLEQQKAAAAAAKSAKVAAPQLAASSMAQADTITTASPALHTTAKKRRKGRAERARRKGAAERAPQQQEQQLCTKVAGTDSSAVPAAAAADTDVAYPITVSFGAQLGTHHLFGHQQDQQHKLQKQQQQALKQQQETASSAAAASSGSSGGSSVSGGIHAFVMLDPIYRDGEVVGYVVQRTVLSPQGVKGAPKLVLKEVLALLKAEGRTILQHGLAPVHNIKPGAYHGFTDCAWLTLAFQLSYEHGNSLYAFKNLAMAKSSWGGGYTPEKDSLKFKEAVTLNRRFVLLPPSFSCPLGHGPLMLLLVWRHMGLLGDPWQLFAFWRYW